MQILLFLLRYWKYFAVLGVALAAVLWYNKQMNDAYDLGFKQAEAIITLSNTTRKEQERTVIQEQSRELVSETGKQQENVRILTKEVIKYVESIPPKQENTNCPVNPRAIRADDEFVRLWNLAAASEPFKYTDVSGVTAKEVPK